jgi:hypothetical protein
MAVLAAACVLLSGCARRVPVSELESAGAQVGVAVTLTGGDELECRLLSLSSDDMLVDVYYRIGGEVQLRGTGSGRRVVSKGEEVPGELAAVVQESPGRRTAIVRRTIDLDEVSRATFHRSGSEASLGPVLSLFVGPIVGALLALLI